MMNFLKDWIIQYQNKFSVGGVETTIDRITGTVLQEGDTIMASYLNEIQKNCIYQVNANRVVEGVLEIYDITIDGSEEFTPFNQTFLIDFSATNTKVDSLLRFNGITYSLRFSDSISNGDIAPKIGFIPKRALVKLDVTNSKAIIVDFNPNNFISPAFTGTPTAPTAAVATNSTQIATTAFVKSVVDSSGSFTQSLAANGWTKLPNGLILQWGTTSAVSMDNPGVTINFPIAFPNACFSVTATFMAYNTGGSGVQGVSSISKASFVVFNGQDAVGSFRWIAIGY